MKRSGMLLCGLLFFVGFLLLVYLAPGWLNPFGWSWNDNSYSWGPGLLGRGGLGFPIMAFVMLVFCLLMMGGMLSHGGPHMHSSHGSWISQPRESLSDILARRYSQGEITKEQFEELRQTLSVSDASSANEHARS